MPFDLAVAQTASGLPLLPLRLVISPISGRTLDAQSVRTVRSSAPNRAQNSAYSVLGQGLPPENEHPKLAVQPAQALDIGRGERLPQSKTGDFGGDAGSEHIDFHCHASLLGSANLASGWGR
jgi:hypothetical protein